MTMDLIIRRQDLVENPTPRVAVCLVLDCSPSMLGERRYGSFVEQTDPRPIEALNQGVKAFIEELQQDEIARYSAEIAVVAFSKSPETILDFESITRITPPTIEVPYHLGGTSIGSAVSMALKLLNQRKEEYKDAGVDYYQPWLVLMTDGRPTDDTHLKAAEIVKNQVLNKSLSVFPIGIGAGADMNVLAMFSPSRAPLRLQGLKFREFFQWLSQSVSTTSQSMPGEAIHLDINGIKGWAEL